MSHKLEWFDFSAKSVSQKSAISDGYNADYPCTSVAVLAECSDGDIVAAEKAAAIVRDTFGEGVIWKPGETLRDSVADAIDKAGFFGDGKLSIAAIAVAGENAWVVMHGECRILIPNIDYGVGLESKENHYKKIEHFLLTERTTVIIFSPTLGRLVDNIGLDWKFLLNKHEYSKICIQRLLDETGGRYRTSGGSVILLGEFPQKFKVQIPIRQRQRVLFLFVIVLLLLILFLCDDNVGINNHPEEESPEIPVLPLSKQSLVTEDDSARLEEIHLTDDDSTTETSE